MAAMSPEDPHPTGVAELDREHALELRVVREIQAALLEGERDQALALLERLEDFTNAHFLTEQLLMRLHAYPGYEAHQQEHDRLIGELQELSRVLASGGPSSPSSKWGSSSAGCFCTWRPPTSRSASS